MPRRQAGYALVILMTLIATVSMIYLGNALRNASGNADVRAQRSSLRALREAQTALVGYAALEDNTPGTLPCPSPGVNGHSTSLCTNGTDPATLGRMPWHRLGLNALRDGAGQCLWYALSLTHRNQPTYAERGTSADTPAIHPDTAGVLSLQRDGASTSAVAVLLAPGLATTGAQSALRSPSAGGIDCSGGPAAAYFEAFGGVDNADGDGSFVDASSDPTFNDRLRAIDQRTLLRPVLRRTLKALSAADMRTELLARMASIGGGTGTLSALRDLDNKQHEFDVKLEPTAPAVGAACPTTVSKHPVGWLCVNGWYDKIEYSQSTLSLTVSLDSSSASAYRCRMRLIDGTIQCGVGT